MTHLDAALRDMTKDGQGLTRAQEERIRAAVEADEAEASADRSPVCPCPACDTDPGRGPGTAGK